MVSVTFLQPVAEEIINLGMISDRDGLMDYDASSPTFKSLISWARVTYGAISGYCGRTFESATVTDIYKNVEVAVGLRLVPISSVTSVKIIGESSNLDASGYTLDGNDLYLGRHRISVGSGDVYLGNIPVDIKVVYTGGLTLPTDDDTFFSALVRQTYLFYQSKHLFGKKSFAFEQTKVEAADSKMDIPLSPQIKESLAEFKYEGDGYEVK